MPRTENDTWDITEGVGATALGVAAGRAAETASAAPLISDPYAQLFLDAVGDGVPNLYLTDDEMPAELTDIDPRIGERMQAMQGYLASRTLFFDQFFLDAAAAGVTQAVILAAGLDARAWRLDWPAGAAVYELDQPKVLDFKVSTLASHGAAPRATYVAVPVDLRHDWPAALVAAGFDPAVPTAWAAEGLLPYLTAAAQDILFDRIVALSAPRSRVAVEEFTRDFFSADALERREEQAQRYRDIAAKLGHGDGNGTVTDLSDLLYDEQRVSVVDWLTEHHWQATGIAAADLMAGNGRSVAADLGDDATPQSVFVEGRLP